MQIDISDCTGTKIGENICRTSTSNDPGPCDAEKTSFVHVSKTGNVFTYSICLTAGKDYKYIKNGLESDLLNSNNTSMIYPRSS